MSEILSVGGFSPPLSSNRLTPDSAAFPPTSGPDPDIQGGVAATRFSDALRRIVDRSSLRNARLRVIRTEIENGTYETPARISGTVVRLLDVIA